MSAAATEYDVVRRAELSRGGSSQAILHMVGRELDRRSISGGFLLDVGCGTGALGQVVGDKFDRYAGADVVRHEGFPTDAQFHLVDVDQGGVPLPDESVDVVASVETVEHVENPRQLMRELVRLAKPGGWIVVTTPNQLSLLSKMTLLLRNEFNAFRAGSYPAHITALLEVDLRRMATELKLTDIEIAFTHNGRIVGTAWHYPQAISRLFPRAMSDNILLMARKPTSNEVVGQASD
ncbi:class I SAM-dependent methyltransferase [Blastopirellula retiformator]|uniref:Putative S-adenosylmethionine-dependent methyltransferase n=1 Tax=Blastopirellula retiformator TaxID=2527970 RepID=A0A5C5V691_9BACT|nr:class I SAM-dependent methyltransferase [Blastopirellula retiformator]TWT34104.1 putative S-adenosylmethionine-dependent methyltransferase [Blastopirellula retiformator]